MPRRPGRLPAVATSIGSSSATACSLTVSPFVRIHVRSVEPTFRYIIDDASIIVERGVRLTGDRRRAGLVG